MADWLPKRTLGALPREAALRWGAREALVFEGERWTYSEFGHEVARVAKALIGLGVAPGDRIALWMVNRPEWLFLQYAVADVGAVLVPLNTRLRVDDVAYALDHSEATVLIALDRAGPVDYLAMLVEVMPELRHDPAEGLRSARLPHIRHVLLLGERAVPGAIPWATALEAGRGVDDATLAARGRAVDPDDLALIAYTSGTTGAPKGVMHDHASIRAAIDRANRIGVTFTDVMMVYLPLFHIYGYAECSLLALVSGAKQILMEGFEADEALRLAEAEGATVLHGFDTHWRDMMLSLERRPRELSRLRLGTFPAGMRSSAPIAARAQGKLCPTVSGYGMTESWAFVTTSFPGDTAEQRCEASGFPMPGYEFRIVDPESGREMGPGAEGEILMRGYMVTRGYYKNPEATAAAIDAEGWLHSGDAGTLREDGHLVFLGRHKDMLKVGGENVSPAEVEEYLLEMGGVAEVAVVGLPDAHLSEVPVAVIREQAEGAAPDSTAIDAALRGRIASFKIPRHVMVVDAMPMTASGKIRKHELRARVLARLGARA